MRHTIAQYCPETISSYVLCWSLAGVFEKAYGSQAFETFPIAKISVDRLMSSVKNHDGTDILGLNPTDRGRETTKIGDFVDFEGTSIALPCHCSNVHDNPTVQSPI